MGRKLIFIICLAVPFLILMTGCRKTDGETESTGTIEAPTAVIRESEEETEDGSEEDGQPYSNKGLVKSPDFGKYVAAEVQDMNERTLNNRGSGIVDLSRLVLSVTDVLEMINSYELPDTEYYGEEKKNDDVCSELLEYRNLDGLEERRAIGIDSINREYGILVMNADVRSFPTDMKAADGTDEKAFDMFQETKLPYGSGIMILHRTVDRKWAFVQGENYYGWINADAIALCDYDTYRNYQSPDYFIISNGQAFDPKDDSSRLGVVIPLRVVGDQVMKVLPGKSSNGRFFENMEPYEKSDGYHEGYYPYDESMPETAASLFKALEGTPYGWGDENGCYDCSSSAGLILRLFGIITPRNTSDFQYCGAERTDISGMTDDEKCDIINQLSGALLLMPGHIMMTAGGTEVVHCVTSYYTASDGASRTEPYGVMISDLKEMYEQDGSTMLSELTDLFVFR